MNILHRGCSIDRQCCEIIRSPFWHLDLTFLKGHLFHDGHTVNFTWYKSCYYKLQARLSRFVLSVVIFPALSCMQTERTMKEERERGWTNVDVLRMERFWGRVYFQFSRYKTSNSGFCQSFSRTGSLLNLSWRISDPFWSSRRFRGCFVNWLNWKQIIPPPDIESRRMEGWVGRRAGWLAENLFLSKRDVR